MKLNEEYYGFKVIQVQEIEDVKSKMYVFKHKHSGATLVYLENDDDNKCFSIGFKTLPEDSTGICHILEHSVLCGSDKYPLKEPFVNLLKSSMATFLNAMTASDFTIYPVASQNDQDFTNLVSVYLDAVFAPLSIKDPKPFLQEGWHLEMNDVNEMPTYKGVVYNEMIGATSSVDEQLLQHTLSTMFKGTIYEHNSGGEPKDIPNLTYKYYQDFYHKHYIPSNSLMYLYGKMDVLEKLKFFNDEYLSKYSDPKTTINIEFPKPIIDRNQVFEYAIADSEDEADNTYMDLCFAVDDFNNIRDLIGFSILNNTIASTNESPLIKAILDANLGQDVETYFDDNHILACYHIMLSKTNPEEKERFYNVVKQTCEKLVKDGIDKEQLIATINRAEFRKKENDTKSFPVGLLYGMSLMQAYLYEIPYENILEFSSYFNYFRENINNGYFEQLIEKYILNSNHYVEVTLVPSRTKEKKDNEELSQKLTKIYEKMTDEEKLETVKITKELLEYQAKKDTKEELDTLPKLTKDDLTPDVRTLTTEEKTINEIKYLIHQFDTNEIAYLKMYFDLSPLTEEEILYTRTLIDLLIELDTNTYSATTIQSKIKTYLGRLNFSLYCGSKTKDDLKTKLVIDVAALEDNIDKIAELINIILWETDFNEDKIKTNLLQMKNACRNEIIEEGTSVAIDEVRAHLSKEGHFSASLHGVRMYRFLTNLIDKYDEIDIKTIFENIISKLINRNTLLVSASGTKEIIDKLIFEVEKIRMNSNKQNDCYESKIESVDNAAIIVPAGVNYNAKGINLGDLKMIGDGRLLIFRHIINFDYLWPVVRVMGGAYGCSLSISGNDDLICSSYRDPNVKETYKAYDEIINYLKELNLSDEDFTSYLIGAVGKSQAPLSNNSLINMADGNYIRNVSDEERLNLKKEMIETTQADVKELLTIFENLAKSMTYYTVGDESKIKGYQFNKVDKL